MGAWQRWQFERGSESRGSLIVFTVLDLRLDSGIVNGLQTRGRLLTVDDFNAFRVVQA